MTYLGHVFEEHALRLVASDDAQQTDDVGMAQLGHELHFATEILLRFQRSAGFQRLDGDRHDTARADQVVADVAAMRRSCIAVHQFSFVNL